MMKCITPLPAVSEENLEFLRKAHKACTRTLRFNRNLYGVTSYFIDDKSIFNEILERIIKPVGIPYADIGNMWNDVDPSFNCSGINFNVLESGDYALPHIDTNPTKINILLSGSTDNHIHFVEEDEKWSWVTPALIDVSKMHRITDDVPIESPRVMMQIFLTKPYDHYKNTINLNPEW